jgi:predicted  nucleic acid-binding Zn-ribbon protein
VGPPHLQKGEHMSKFLWQDLKKLVAIDQQIIANGQEANALKAAIITENDAITYIEHQLIELKEQFASLQKDVDILEIETKKIDDYEKNKQDALATSSDIKHISALRKELDILALKRQDLEDALISGWKKLESSKHKLELAKNSHNQNITKHTEEIKKITQKIEVNKNTLAALIADEKQLLETIPKEWLSKYQRMKGRVANPIIPIKQDICSSCYYLVLRQDLERIVKGALLPCRNCYRFLYFDIDAPTTEQASY